MAIAARVAAKLRSDGMTVELKRGGMGELRVEDGARTLYEGNRLLYSTPGRILAQVRRRLSDSA